MYKKAKDCAKKNESNCWGGNGTFSIKFLTDRDGLYNHGRMFAHVTLPVGCSIGPHTHVDETDFYYIIKGEGILNDNGREIVVREGDICYAGNGEFHALANNSDTDLEMITLIAEK